MNRRLNSAKTKKNEQTNKHTNTLSIQIYIIYKHTYIENKH